LFFFGRFLRNSRHGGAQELALSADPVLTNNIEADSDQDDYEARIERELRERYP
jgi:hypothetical protein